MVQSSYLSFAYLSMLTLLLVSNCHADLISDVCSKSTNSVTCNQALRSDPASHGADLSGLARIVIGKATVAARSTYTVADTYYLGPLKGYVALCEHFCDGARNNLETCLSSLESNDKMSLIEYSRRAFEDVRSCDEAFGDLEPSNVKGASKYAQDLINVLQVIAKIL